MRPFLKNRKLKAFTLIELLLVIFIITLVYISIITIVSDTSRADYEETKLNLAFANLFGSYAIEANDATELTELVFTLAFNPIGFTLIPVTAPVIEAGSVEFE